jgi:hypothetical protein
VNDVEKKERDETTSLDTLVADHIFKGKSRGVSLRSVLGEDDDSETKRIFKKSGSIISMI